MSILPEVSSGAVRTGAKYLPSFIGSALDFGFQVFVDGEDATDAAFKAGGHGVISTMAGTAGFAVGGPAGALLGVGLAYAGGKAFDWVYDHADDIREGASDLWEGTKNFVGDAWSGMTDGLGTIFD